MTVTETVTEVSPPTVDDAPPARRRSPGFVVAAVLAVVFFASTVLLAVVAAGLKADKDELADGRAEVAEAAGRFVDALLSYDHRDLEGFRASAVALTAPPFSEQFEAAVDALADSIVATEQVSTPTIEEVFVTEVEDGTATAIVSFSRVIESTAGEREENGLYVELGLIEREDGWRVNDVANLNLAYANSLPEDGSTTTTAG